jgi:tRNA (guanine-N7-)-methyltransferase
MSNPNASGRQVRSFVLREGRMTDAQRRNLDRLWPAYGLEAGSPIDWTTVFGRNAPRTLEIGFGNGDHLLGEAAAHPESDFVGIEVHRPGIGRLLGHAAAREVKNLRVFRDDAVRVLATTVAPGSLDTLLLYFPDPWPKKRHHKRRIVQPAFADLVARALKPGGRWLLATDWADYAEHMRATLNTHPEFANLATDGGFVPRPPERPETKFERRGLKLGHAVFDLAFQRR